MLSTFLRHPLLCLSLAFSSVLLLHLIPVTTAFDAHPHPRSRDTTHHHRHHQQHRQALRRSTDRAAQSPLVVTATTDPTVVDPAAVSFTVDVRSVNYFISRACNYSCQFCFHTATNSKKLSLTKALAGLTLLKEAGTEKINFAGGEPFLNPTLLGELCRMSHGMGMAVSIISNGSLIKAEWMEEYGQFVDVLGVSCDSFSPATNTAIGRGGDADNKHAERVLAVRELCAQHDIMFKINTVVCSLNWQEDMTESIRLLNPVRWKVFEVLILEGENSGADGDLRDATGLTLSKGQFESFVDRHKSLDSVMIPEPNDVMRDSYLLLDEEMRFLDCSNGGKIPSDSILDVGVHLALQQAGFNKDMFEKRGGVYDWTRDRSAQYLSPSTSQTA